MKKKQFADYHNEQEFSIYITRDQGIKGQGTEMRLIKRREKRNRMRNTKGFSITLSRHLEVTIKKVLEKAMVPHSSTLDWKIPCREEPGRLQSMGSLRVGHD